MTRPDASAARVLPRGEVSFDVCEECGVLDQVIGLRCLMCRTARRFCGGCEEHASQCRCGANVNGAMGI